MMDYGDADNAISYAESVRDELSKIVFDSSIINCDSMDFGTAYATLKDKTITELEESIENMRSLLDEMKKIDNEVYNGNYIVPSSYR